MNRGFVKNLNLKYMALNCYKIILILCFTLLTISCKQNQSLLYNFEKNSWNSKDSILFSFDVFDSAEPKNMSFFLRNNLDYPYRNIFFFVEIQNDSGTIVSDTVQYLISNKYGQWLGRGFGKTRDNYFIFKKNYLFEDAGNHLLIIRHGMRQNKLKGLVKFGFEID